MKSLIQSPHFLKRRLQQPNVFNPKNKSLLQLREFLNQVQKVKTCSKTPKRPRNQTTPQSHSLFKTNKRPPRNIPSRKTSKPLPFITFKQIQKTSTRPNSQLKRETPKQFQGLKQTQQVPEGQPIKETISNYYKKYLFSASTKVTLDSKDICLSISRITASELEPRVRRRSIDIINSKKFSVLVGGSKGKSRTRELSGYFGKYDTPWEDLKSRDL